MADTCRVAQLGFPDICFTCIKSEQWEWWVRSVLRYADLRPAKVWTRRERLRGGLDPTQQQPPTWHKLRHPTNRQHQEAHKGTAFLPQCGTRRAHAREALTPAQQQQTRHRLRRPPYRQHQETHKDTACQPRRGMRGAHSGGGLDPGSAAADVAHATLPTLMAAPGGA
ncbi:hypothetical protein NDU88_000745 [Pleurodeles waltl]|uniref:Uncharacterized protein n=1 Tax=Pleurodeles waltl TaxID=8319 RepID=A0AAV7KQS3_PLEWA|nr:hypothetical protein NDU88_000745 [Pleurodeles waltl]